MPLLPPPTDYTPRDYSSWRARLLSLWRSAWPPLPDDGSSPTVTMLEAFSHVADSDSYYLNDSGREAFMPRTRRRNNALAHSRFLNYTPQTREAATVSLTFTLSRIPTSPVTIPAGTLIKTRDLTTPVEFQLLADVVIAVGTNPPVGTGDASHSVRVQETYDVDGLVNLSVPLRQSPVIESSVAIADAVGDYTRVNGLASAGGSDLVYILELDDFDRARTLTGDGENGATPTGSLSISYRTGGGSDGNVEADTLQRLDGAILDALGRSVTATVTNPLKASGGFTRESTASIKLNAPSAFTTILRSVTAQDFENNAKRVSGVARALMLTSNQDASVEENTGHLLIVPAGGGLPTQTLRDQVEALILNDFPPPLTFDLRVLGQDDLPIDIDVGVFLDADADGPTVRDAIEANLAVFFDPLNADDTPNTAIDFGARAGELAWSDVFNVIRDTVGVDSMSPSGLKLNNVVDNITLAPRDFPSLGVTLIKDASTGIPL